MDSKKIFFHSNNITESTPLLEASVAIDENTEDGFVLLTKTQQRQDEKTALLLNFDKSWPPPCHHSSVTLGRSNNGFLRPSPLHQCYLSMERSGSGDSAMSSLSSSYTKSEQEEAAINADDECSELQQLVHPILVTLPTANETNTNNSWMTVLSILPFLQGAGILSVPYAFLIAGKAFLPAMLFIGFLGHVCSRLLIDSTYKRSCGNRYRKYHSYEDLAFACWGIVGFRLIQVVNYTFLLMACVVNFVLMFHCLDQLAGDFIIQHHIHLTSIQFGSIFSFVVIPVLMFAKGGKIFGYLGLLATVTIFLTTVCSLFVFAHSYKSWPSNFNQISVIDWDKYPVAMGIATLTIIATPALPSIESVMSNPKSFPVAVGASFAFSSGFKTVYGVLGVLSFGLNTNEIIAANLSGYSQIIRYVVSILLVLNATVNSICYMQLVLMSLDEQVFTCHRFPINSSDHPWYMIWKLVSRCLFLVLSLAVTDFLPYFALVSSLIGALFGSFLALISPVLFHLTLKWRSMAVKERLAEFVFLLFTIALCFWMSFASVRDLMHEFTKS